MKLRDLLGEERAKFGFTATAKSIDLPKKEVEEVKEKPSKRKLRKGSIAAAMSDINMGRKK